MQSNHNAIHLTEVSPDELAARYAYPEELTRPYLRANFVSSIDGASTSGDLSEGLGTPADKAVFMMLRELCEVILVGAGTVRTENYAGARTDRWRRKTFAERGYGGDADGAAPPIAVVTANAELAPDARLFTDTDTAPLILTTAAAPADRKRRLADAGAEVIEAGDAAVTPKGLLRELDARGLRRVLCEGGPHLFGQLAQADQVDELCLTTAPLLVGGTTRRIALSAQEFRLQMRREHVLLDDDGTMLTRWARR